jgi:hypothetical protein
MFKEVDRPLKFPTPAGTGDTALRVINHDQRSGRDQGVHGPVLGADQAVPMTAQVDIVQKHQREFSPPLNELA